MPVVSRENVLYLCQLVVRFPAKEGSKIQCCEFCEAKLGVYFATDGKVNPGGGGGVDG
jgi:hypothetical protein